MYKSNPVVTSPTRLRFNPTLAIALATALSVPAFAGSASGGQQIEIVTLSTNGSPNLVSGGDVLVALKL